MEKQGLAVDDGNLVETMRQWVETALQTIKARGMAVSERERGWSYYGRWLSLSRTSVRRT